ncbi:MAG: hypothetical protein ACREKL_07365, partial [Chthoniobacterales bacterium]
AVTFVASAQLPDTTPISSDATIYNFNVASSPVPEPATTSLLIATGCGALLVARSVTRRRRSSAKRTQV